jgi:lipopolysaccharide biosynthesis glycosyltransferase
MNKIFIGYEEKQKIAADVLKFSLLKHSTIPLDIQYLKLSELDFPRPIDPLQSTEFTYSRFLVPSICNYQGTALFLDCDILCLSDVKEIFELPMEEYAIRVVKQVHVVQGATTKMGGKSQVYYPRKNWSSVMFMNCEKLRYWSKDYVCESVGLDLHQFKGLEKSDIGVLPLEWNHLDHRNAKTKMLHYTSGGPWLPGCENHPQEALWHSYEQEFRQGEATPPPAEKL